MLISKFCNENITLIKNFYQLRPQRAPIKELANGINSWLLVLITMYYLN